MGAKRRRNIRFGQAALLDRGRLVRKALALAITLSSEIMVRVGRVIR
jgi:hypothetical protein